MRSVVQFLPIVTTLIAIPFTYDVYRRYRQRGGPHLLWWSLGILLFGVGTFTEASVTLFSWHETTFRAWYIAGALLGGAPLAQGTVYLLLSRRAANRLTAVLLPVIAIAAVCVLLTPIDYTAVEPHRLTGRVMEWSWVRAFSPFINTYAFVFLVGGAVLSAFRYFGKSDARHRFVGNVCIAAGALLPGIGGTATRFGHTEVLYVTELIGLSIIWIGYRTIVNGSAAVRRQPVPTLDHAPAGESAV